MAPLDYHFDELRPFRSHGRAQRGIDIIHREGLPRRHAHCGRKSGDIEIGMRAGLRLWIDASSLSGSMVSELEVIEAPPGDDAPLVELHAKSVSGDLRVRRASPVVPAAPA